MSVFLGQVEGMGCKGHISFNLPGHWSFEELAARLWLESMFVWQLPAAETKLLSTSLGSGSQSGHCSYVQSQEGFVLCCLCKVAVSAPDTHCLLLLPGSSLALTPLAWDWFPFWGCCRCLSPDSDFCKHTSAPCRQVSLCFPGSPFSAQLPTRLIRHSDLFLHLFVIVMEMFSLDSSRLLGFLDVLCPVCVSENVLLQASGTLGGEGTGEEKPARQLCM